MNNIAVVTTFPDASWKVYAEKMLQSYVAQWPGELSLLVHLDTEFMANDVDKIIRPQDGLICGHSPEQIAFLQRNAGKDDKSDYRKQACRFSHKVYTLKSASDYWTKQNVSSDAVKCRYLIWLDADVLTTRKVTIDDIKKCLPQKGDAVSYLGRKDWDHSECGWLAFDLDHGGNRLIDAVYDQYQTDKIFEEDQWHDSYIFDQTIKKNEFKATNLTPHAVGRDVWEQSPMAAWSRHYKGPIAKDALAENVPKKEKLMPMKVQTINSIPSDDICKNIFENQGMITQWVTTCLPTDEEIIVVSAGPTMVAEDLLPDYLAGKKIVAVKHALKPLKEAGIKPWACILLDPREHVPDFVKGADKDILWFTASQISPKAVQSLLDDGCNVWGYHASVCANEEKYTEKQWDSVVSGGSATATRGLFLLDKLGFRKFKLMGYDLCLPDKPDLNAKDERGQPKYFEVSIEAKTPHYEVKRAFWTTGELIAQFEELKNIISTKSWEIKAEGYGIFPFMLNSKKVSDLRQAKKRGKLPQTNKVSYEEMLGCNPRIPLLTRLRTMRLKRRLRRSKASS